MPGRHGSVCGHRLLIRSSCRSPPLPRGSARFGYALLLPASHPVAGSLGAGPRRIPRGALLRPRLGGPRSVDRAPAAGDHHGL